MLVLLEKVGEISDLVNLFPNINEGIIIDLLQSIFIVLAYLDPWILIIQSHVDPEVH